MLELDDATTAGPVATVRVIDVPVLTLPQVSVSVTVNSYVPSLQLLRPVHQPHVLLTHHVAIVVPPLEIVKVVPTSPAPQSVNDPLTLSPLLCEVIVGAVGAVVSIVNVTDQVPPVLTPLLGTKSNIYVPSVSPVQ